MVPAFNCSVIKENAATFGYQVQVYDFSPKPGIFEWQKVIDPKDHLSAICSLLIIFGIPVDLRPAIEYVKVKGIAIIEDCAHTLGGKIAGRWAGTYSDAAILTFNHDKPTSLSWGGLALVNNPNLFDITKPVKFRVPTKKSK